MFVKDKDKVYTQRDWTDKELVADGFLSYAPIKRVTMARMLPSEETSKRKGNTLVTKAGYWIAYVTGDVLKARLDEYKQRPIAPNIFAETYRPWDESLSKLTSIETYLQKLGCKCYYNIANVWAKRLDTKTWVQGIESDAPTLTPRGMWLCVGTEGEPWCVTDAWFQAHYHLPGQPTSNTE